MLWAVRSANDLENKVPNPNDSVHSRGFSESQEMGGGRWVVRLRVGVKGFKEQSTGELRKAALHLVREEEAEPLGEGDKKRTSVNLDGKTWMSPREKNSLEISTELDPEASGDWRTWASLEEASCSWKP